MSATAGSAPQSWRDRLKAMSTPLASIFGSGFLVIVSVLGGAVGPYSVLAMAGICAVAYAVGSVIRHNIRHAEPVLQNDDTPRGVAIASTVAQLALIPAYVISVTLYLRILSSYALGFFGAKGAFDEKLLTTGIIGIVLALALTKGLSVLEASEGWALGATVAIIALLIGEFGLYDLHALSTGGLVLPSVPGQGLWHMATVLAGTLIVVQGFETTRYLGDEFDAGTRVQASRDAQIVSTGVYLLFVAGATPLMHFLPDRVEDNALMILVATVAGWLTVPLVLVAIFSQFSAAVADAVSGSGSLVEVSRKRIGRSATYVVICLAAIGLCWIADTFTILALASRAFAFYYCAQCGIAILVSNTVGTKARFGAMALLLAFVTVFATPVG